MQEFKTTEINNLEILATSGNELAQKELGERYELGRGVDDDIEKALYWYKLSAAQGNSDAQNNIGRIYFVGKHIPINIETAKYWWLIAAENGNPRAQSNLSNIYRDGIGVDQNFVKAIYWCRLAAEQGNAQAQSNMGWFYVNGLGIGKDDSMAAYWWSKAAEQGDSHAQLYLGMAFETGEGVRRDISQAIKWWTLASEQGNSDAKELLENIKNEVEKTNAIRSNTVGHEITIVVRGTKRSMYLDVDELTVIKFSKDEELRTDFDSVDDLIKNAFDNAVFAGDVIETLMIDGNDLVAEAIIEILDDENWNIEESVPLVCQLPYFRNSDPADVYDKIIEIVSLNKDDD